MEVLVREEVNEEEGEKEMSELIEEERLEWEKARELEGDIKKRNNKRIEELERLKSKKGSKKEREIKLLINLGILERKDKYYYYEDKEEA